ncbi:yeats family-domain-containing protein [Mycena galopus ATCC 62051]|nr:yeats family-domain-containing protein [Mycena galopus ATCC 62051]
MAAERVRVRVGPSRPFAKRSSQRHRTTHIHGLSLCAASASDQDIVGGADDLSHFIKRVTFKLHDTYPNPSRNIDKPPFEVTETGWGEFEIQIRITFVPDAGKKPITLYHHLKLHPWTATGDPEIPPLGAAIKADPVHSCQYDELVFNDPFQTFLATLTSNPPTPLVRSRRKPVPFHLAHMGSLEASKGGTPEFMQQMEEEAERLEEARKAIVAEEERWRAKLVEKEKELQSLGSLAFVSVDSWQDDETSCVPRRV